jgi:hypothetical protein
MPPLSVIGLYTYKKKRISADELLEIKGIFQDGG